jgi:hypothetical protein
MRCNQNPDVGHEVRRKPLPDVQLRRYLVATSLYRTRSCPVARRPQLGSAARSSGATTDCGCYCTAASGGRLTEPQDCEAVPTLGGLELSRWAASFPTAQRRCFVIMPFREALGPTWAAIQSASTGTQVRVERGDQAPGQEIIGSIWAEIGRATEVVVDLTGLNPNVCIELGIADTLGKPALLIGAGGTEAELADRIPSLAKRRCHPYTRSDDPAPVLARFFAGELAWV